MFPMSEIEKHQQYIEIWSKAVETQMHFNEMQVKSRQLGLTFVAAALGVGIVLLSDGKDFAFKVLIGQLHFQLHVSVLLVIGALLALEAVKLLDLGVYHRMLRGAVTFGEDFEANYLSKVFDLEKGMTEAISHFSRHDDATVSCGKDGKFRYCGTNKVTAHDKIRKFYRNTQGYLILTAIVLLLFTNAASIYGWWTVDENLSQKSATTEQSLSSGSGTPPHPAQQKDRSQK